MPNSRTNVAIAAVAAVLAGTAIGVYASARRAERAHPPRGRFVTAGGVRLHYLEAGAGSLPPVVLLHGNGATAEDWIASGVFAHIAERRRVIAFDRPGYGYSERPRDRLWTAGEQAAVLAAAFDAIGVERPLVVGHSWGALVAVALGLDNEASGLVLASGYYFPTARPDVIAFSPPAIPVIGDVIRYTLGPLVGRLLAPKILRTVFAPASVPSRFTRAVPVSIMLRPWQIKASAEDSATMIPWTAAMQDRYPELRDLPIAILAGGEDQIVDLRQHSARLHQLLPRSDFRVAPGLGHMVHHGAAGMFMDAIESLAPARDTAGLERPVEAASRAADIRGD